MAHATAHLRGYVFVFVCVCHVAYVHIHVCLFVWLDVCASHSCMSVCMVGCVRVTFMYVCLYGCVRARPRYSVYQDGSDAVQQVADATALNLWPVAQMKAMKPDGSVTVLDVDTSWRGMSLFDLLYTSQVPWRYTGFETDNFKVRGPTDGYTAVVSWQGSGVPACTLCAITRTAHTRTHTAVGAVTTCSCIGCAISGGAVVRTACMPGVTHIWCGRVCALFVGSPWLAMTPWRSPVGCLCRTITMYVGMPASRDVCVGWRRGEGRPPSSGQVARVAPALPPCPTCGPFCRWLAGAAAAQLPPTHRG